MSNWGNCPNCHEYDVLTGSAFIVHKCKPAWECRMESMDEDDWRKVHAYDDESAAERFAERYDQESGDYNIIANGGDGYFVLVRKLGGDEVNRFAISAENVPHYSAISAD